MILTLFLKKLRLRGKIKMENKHIQNYQNENTNNKNRKINSGEIHIHKNEYIKNEDKTQNKYHILKQLIWTNICRNM